MPSKKEQTPQKDIVVDTTPRGKDGAPGGTIHMAEHVVASVAGLAVRDIDGIHSLGRSRLIRLGGDSPTRGVAAEVGSKEAALDLEVILEYGCDIRAVAGEVRQRIADEVNRMTGRKVVEVNLDVVGINIERPEQAPPQPEGARVL